ncbi:hypothetical protein [Ornithinimicrobium pratense]|nr:hypothetical protein [Ornithinimicrobium pratense]
MSHAATDWTDPGVVRGGARALLHRGDAVADLRERWGRLDL